MFLLFPPYVLRGEPFFKRRDACKTKESDVRAGGVAIANQCAIVSLLRTVNLLWRSLFSADGSFGLGGFELQWSSPLQPNSLLFVSKFVGQNY